MLTLNIDRKIYTLKTDKVYSIRIGDASVACDEFVVEQCIEDGICQDPLFIAQLTNGEQINITPEHDLFEELDGLFSAALEKGEA